MYLRDTVEKIKAEGYSEANAEAKLCQDIVLKAIFESGMGRNATIKGGIVMRSISKNARRATQDIDLDFIRYSISDESIRSFIEKLNCLEGLKISIGDDTLKNVNSIDDVVKRVERVFTNKRYVQEVEKSGKNWIGIPTEEVLKKDIEFLKGVV